jgi:two-component system, OmpR family, response regulator
VGAKSGYIAAMSLETILIVDDDREIRTLLAAYMQQAGFFVTVAANAEEMFARLAQSTPSLVILDVMMPKEDGMVALSKLRQQKKSRVPVLLLTALGEPEERSAGLEAGADDYLGKPFLPRELLARVNAILRRTPDTSHASSFQTKTIDAASAPTPDAIANNLRYFGRWMLDLNRHQVFHLDGEEIMLTSAEFKLLSVFAERSQRVLSRETLFILTHPEQADAFDRSIDVLISRLRQKFGDSANNAGFIRTVRGGGYMLVPAVYRDREALLANQAPHLPAVKITLPDALQ